MQQKPVIKHVNRMAHLRIFSHLASHNHHPAECTNVFFFYSLIVSWNAKVNRFPGTYVSATCPPLSLLLLFCSTLSSFAHLRALPWWSPCPCLKEAGKRLPPSLLNQAALHHLQITVSWGRVKAGKFWPFSFCRVFKAFVCFTFCQTSKLNIGINV